MRLFWAAPQRQWHVGQPQVATKGTDFQYLRQGPGRGSTSKIGRPSHNRSAESSGGELELSPFTAASKPSPSSYLAWFIVEMAVDRAGSSTWSVASMKRLPSGEASR